MNRDRRNCYGDTPCGAKNPIKTCWKSKTCWLFRAKVNTHFHACREKYRLHSIAEKGGGEKSHSTKWTTLTLNQTCIVRIVKTDYTENDPINQSINQLTNQSIEPSINGPINQSTEEEVTNTQSINQCPVWMLAHRDTDPSRQSLHNRHTQQTPHWKALLRQMQFKYSYLSWEMYSSKFIGLTRNQQKNLQGKRIPMWANDLTNQRQTRNFPRSRAKPHFLGRTRVGAQILAHNAVERKLTISTHGKCLIPKKRRAKRDERIKFLSGLTLWPCFHCCKSNPNNKEQRKTYPKKSGRLRCQNFPEAKWGRRKNKCKKRKKRREKKRHWDVPKGADRQCYVNRSGLATRSLAELIFLSGFDGGSAFCRIIFLKSRNRVHALIKTSSSEPSNFDPTFPIIFRILNFSR